MPYFAQKRTCVKPTLDNFRYSTVSFCLDLIPLGGIKVIMSHADNPQIRNRLRRAEGHLATVVRMVADGRDGLVIAQQLQAVIKALEKTKQMIIVDHIDHHLEEINGPLSLEAQEQVLVFREIVKYL